MDAKWLAALPALIAISLLSACAGAPSISLTNPLVPCPATHYEMVWWSPDGARLAFTTNVHDQTGLHSELFVIDTDGSGLRRVASDIVSEESSIRWSPDGSKIAFVSQMITRNDEVYVVGVEGTGLVRISGNKYETEDSPSWSPDGLQLAYRSHEKSGDDIVVANADGSDEITLTSGFVNSSEPAWSPVIDADGNGLVIAFVQSVNDYGRPRQVFVVSPEGGGATRLTNMSTRVQTPVWSPDGQRILFMFQGPDERLAAVMNHDGSNLRTLFTTDGHGQMLWLPDSQHVSYALQLPPNRYQIEITNIDTLESKLIAFPHLQPITYQSPSWSPDGSQAAFVASAQRNAPSGGRLPDIYITSRDGSVLKRVTDNPGWHTCLQSPFQ